MAPAPGPPGAGDRLLGAAGQNVRVLCRGETFLTLLFWTEDGAFRRYVPLREWPLWADIFTPLPDQRP